jgi:arabinogalactan oligomer/maltooligosaccharide transport system permease protein
MMTACLGALQSIQPEVLQAAEIDGANALQKFLRVTFPLLRAATLPLLISTFAYNLNNFGAVYLLTAGGPPIPGSSYAGSTDILATYTYKLALTARLYGLACAYGVLIFFIIGVLSSINMKLTGAFEEVD